LKLLFPGFTLLALGTEGFDQNVFCWFEKPYPYEVFNYIN